MKRLAISSTLVLLAIVSLLLAGCGGGGGGGGNGGGSNPFSGLYQGTFTRAGDTVLMVAIHGDGATEAVVADGDGLLLQGTGTTTAEGQLSVAMTGDPGDTTLTGAFTRSPGGSMTLTGGINASVQAGKTGSVGTSAFAGKFKIQYQGSESGEIKITISNGGKVYLREGNEQTQIGTITPGGQITFSGEGLVPAPANQTAWTGTVFLTPGSTGGTGTWKDSGNGSIQGTWSAVPDVSGGTPIFNRVTLVSSGSLEIPTVLAVSPNGHMAGVVGTQAVYWSSPDAPPTFLDHAPGSNVSFPTAVNESGTVVGYSYVSGNLGQSHAVVWNSGSTSPTELAYPDQFTSGIASGINASGVIVGLTRKSNGQTRPCIWQSAGQTPVIPPQGDAVSISNAGVVLCQANNGWLPTIEATVMNPLPPAPGYGTLQIQAMGANGIVVGTGELGGDGKRHPLAWNPSAYVPQVLATVQGFQEVVPFAAGGDGTFIGRGRASDSGTYQAFYWKNANEIAALDDIVANSTILFQGGQFIFADGSVIAYGRDADHNFQVAWLQP